MFDGNDARHISNKLIRLGMEESDFLDPLRVIKLTYLSHGWMLGLYGRPLSAQPVEAWKYGPVIPDVYHQHKHCGNTPIKVCVSDRGNDFDELESDLIRQVFFVYNGFTGIQLSQLTHATGSPWHRVWHKFGRNAIIPNSLIRDHFSELSQLDG